LKYGGFLVRCGEEITTDTFVGWWTTMRNHRQHIPIGVVVSLDGGGKEFVDLLNCRVYPWPVITESQMRNAEVLTSSLESIRERAVEGLLLDRWKRRWNLGSRGSVDMAAAAAAVGAAGGRMKTLIGALGRPETGIRRRFADLGLPPPAELLRRARFESVDIRIEMGMTERTAYMSAGWSRLDTYRCARHRWGG
jgi:hypothetical protein